MAFVLLLGIAHAVILSYRPLNSSTPCSNAGGYESVQAPFYWTMYVPDPRVMKDTAQGIDLRELWTSLREYGRADDAYLQPDKKQSDPVVEDSRKLVSSSIEPRIKNPDVP